jgi:CRP-like cAMP-binding protein
MQPSALSVHLRTAVRGRSNGRVLAISCSTEKRLARALLLLARYGKDDTPVRVIPKLSQQIPAAMVGTTRSRVNFLYEQIPEAGADRIQRWNHD